MDGDEQIHGFAFPFRVDARTGGVAATQGADKLRENIKHLLLTRIGERRMMRTYGGGATQLYQENINDGLIAVAQHQISRAIVQFEPRILPQEVAVIPQNGTLYLRVRYIQPGAAGLQSMTIPLDQE